MRGFFLCRLARWQLGPGSATMRTLEKQENLVNIPLEGWGSHTTGYSSDLRTHTSPSWR